MAAVVTGRVAESVGGRRTLDFLRALQQKKIDTERSRRTLRDSDDAARRQRRFATSMALRDGSDASRRQRRFATSATLRDGNDASRRRVTGFEAKRRAGGWRAKQGRLLAWSFIIFGSGARKVVDRGRDEGRMAGRTGWRWGGSGYGFKCKKAVGRAAGGHSKEG